MVSADDINMWSWSFYGAKETLLLLDVAAKEIGVSVDENNTKAMMQTKKRRPSRQNITVGEYNSQSIDSFIANEIKEIRTKVHLANKTPHFNVRCIY